MILIFYNFSITRQIKQAAGRQWSGASTSSGPSWSLRGTDQRADKNAWRRALEGKTRAVQITRSTDSFGGWETVLGRPPNQGEKKYGESKGKYTVLD